LKESCPRIKARDVLTDPSRLSPVDPDSSGTIEVIIETPKGNRNKYAFDAELKIFQLKKALPAGMAFPPDSGFIPSTIADDGDPVGVLVLVDEPAFAGWLLKCRPVGVIEGQQGKKNDKERNDRIVAVERENHSYSHVKHVRDLGKKFLRELEEFFVNDHELSGEKYRILDCKGPGEAYRRMEEGIRAAKRMRRKT
jgi:inorganic pyrophosphatase